MLDRDANIGQNPVMTTQLRHAEPKDAGTIYAFIVELARYEREPDAVKTTSDILEQQLASKNPPFECIIAEVDNTPCGFALYFGNYSTWRGCAGIYLEDLFVKPEFRGRGIGRSLLQRLASLTVARGGERLEWSVLNWNQPAIDFYTTLGAIPMDEWTTWRLTDSALAGLAGH